jgi:hypothetical protein
VSVPVQGRATSRQAVIDAIREAIEELRPGEFDCLQITASTALFHWSAPDDESVLCVGLDSLEFLELLMQVEDRVGGETDFDMDATSVVTVADLAEHFSDVGWSEQ